MKKKRVLLSLSLLACTTVSLASCIKSEPVKSTSVGDGTSIPVESSSSEATPSSSSQNATPAELSSHGTPSASKSSEVTPSRSESSQETPSNSEESQTTPSSSQGLEATPSSSEENQETPSSSLGNQEEPSSQSSSSQSEANETVTITFDVMGGTLAGNTQVIEKGQKVANVTPTRRATVECTYSFAGWYTDDEYNNAFDFDSVVNESITLYAKWDSVINTYSITWKNYDGTILEEDLNVEFGSTPTYNGETPVKDLGDGKTYAFVGWNPVVTDVQGDQEYVATFVDATVTFTITWVNYNGDVLEVDYDVTASDQHTYDGPTPTKPSTEHYSYVFKAWNVSMADNGDITFQAEFNEIPFKYTYTFYNEDGTKVIKSANLDYDSEIVAPADPTKLSDIENIYKFDGWYTAKTGGTRITDFGKLKENVAYYARFTREDRKYTIVWQNYDGSTLKTDENVVYSTAYNGTEPVKNTGDGRVYQFDKFEELSIVNDLVTRKATFTEVKVDYTVTYLDSNGSNLKTITVTSGNTASYGTTPSKTGYKFLYWENDGTEFIETTPVTKDLTLKAVYVEVSRLGFGSNYVSWEDLTKLATNKTVDNGKTILKTQVSLNGFTFKNNDKNYVNKGYGSYNNQGADILVELTSSASIEISGSWASSTNNGYVTIKDSAGNEVKKSDLIKGSGTSFVLTSDDLAAGTYTIHSDYSINVSYVFYEVAKEYATVNFVTNAQDVDPVKLVKGSTLSAFPEITKSNYKLDGWYTDPELTQPFELTTSIQDDLTLYAKWVELSILEKATVTFMVNVRGVTISSTTVAKGSTIILPEVAVDGYRFDNWYTNNTFTKEFDENSTITTDTTLYGRYIKQWTITYKDSENNVIATRKVDDETPFGQVATVTAPYIDGKMFEYWTLNGTEYTDTDDIISDIVLVAKYKNDDGTSVKVNITRNEGLQEGAYILFDNYNNADGYAVYELKNNNPVKLSSKDYYITKTNTGNRVDIFGLAAGTHNFVVAPVIGDTDVINLGAQTSVTVEEYDRSGYAHFNNTEGVGAYNDDGTLKANAIVLYVDDSNKNTVELTYGGITVRGIGNILNSVGQACTDAGHENECKKISDKKTYYGKANTNQGIMKLLAENNIPLVVRFVGCVSNTGLYKKGTFDANSTSLIEGLTAYDSNDFGGSEGDNGHMARIKSGKNITLEGVGSDATIDGWGFHFICETSANNLGKNFEVRNLKFINTPEDAIGMEGQQESNKIVASVERCWIHNNEFYSPDIQSPAESDKSEGDGSVDFKRGMYFTCSYNYFEGCHKTNLVGSSDSSLQYNLTYHHNYWYMCKARGPLTRQANVHMYNNIFYGQTDYALNTRADAYIYSEYNLFYVCKNPYRVDGGAIKSYNDSISSALFSGTNATIVTDKNQVVSSNCAYDGKNYQAFELNSELSYIPTNDYYLQDDVTNAKKVIYARCGVEKASLPQIDAVSMSDVSYINSVVSGAKVNSLTVGEKGSPATITIGKLSKTIYAFEITEVASATIKYSLETDDKTGILCNEAGVAILKGSGTVILKPGKYIIQPYNFAAGDSKKLTQPQFKEIVIESLSLEKHDDQEYIDSLIAEFNAAVNNIPATIEYNEACYSLINAALNKYNQLPESAKSNSAVIANYNTVSTKLNSYKELGVSYVEGKINLIVTPVTTDNANLVYEARNAYDSLLAKLPSAVVSNYNKLVAAEEELESIAINVFLDKVSKLPATIEYNDNSLNAIVAAELAYDSLTAAQKAVAEVVTAHQTLVNARNTYNQAEIEANKVTITYMDGTTKLQEVRVEKNASISLYTPTKSGYRFVGWYVDGGFVTQFTSTSVSADTTLYTKFVEQFTVTFMNKDNTVLAARIVDSGTPVTNVPSAKYVSGFKFKHWSLTANGAEYAVTSEDIYANTTLYAVYEESLVASAINVLNVSSDELESLYVEFEKFEEFTDYNAYVKLDNASTYTKLDKQLIRLYKGASSNYYRVDAVGLKEGSYTVKIVAVNNNVEEATSAVELTNIYVSAHIRTGFGFVTGTGAYTKVTTNTSSGAYNDDGTLRTNAQVIYVTNSNKDTVTLGSYSGVQNIITAMKGGKYISTPVCIRFIGNITDPAVLSKGDLYIDGVTSGLTLEGIGIDATINGFGIVIKNSSNVEVRNLGFMNTDSEEGDSIGLQQGNDHIWVHNNDIFYGSAGSDGDQVKGDGALDTKKSSYITHSFNHFWDTGKSNLQGMKDETTANYITYHHNWYDHSDSRHPRIRTCTVHIYNNYFDGNAKYGVGMTMGGSAFVENNYFRSTATMKPMLTSGQGTDAKGEGTFSGEAGGIIKAYGNEFDGSVAFISHLDSATSFDAYLASSRDEVVPSSYVALSGGTSYNNFDTDSSLMYSYQVESAEDAKNTVTRYAGRIQGGDFKWKFNNETDDAGYAVIDGLKSALTNYSSKLVSVLSESGSQSGETPVVTVTASDVIALIDALPEVNNVTLADTDAINNAKAQYDKLTDGDKVLVTNYSKLTQCLDKLTELGSGSTEPEPAQSQVLTFPANNSFFNVSGNTSTSKGKATVNGVTYSTCLKMESSTSVTFTTTSQMTLTLVFGSTETGKKVLVDGNQYTTDSNGTVTVALAAGSHSITKKDSINLFYVSLA